MTVKFILTDETPKEVFEACVRAGKNLEKEGISPDICVAKPAIKDPEEKTGSCTGMSLSRLAVSNPSDGTDRFINIHRDPEENRDSTLYVTDSSACLFNLINEGCAAVALRHAGNNDEHFEKAAYIFSEPDEIDADSYIKAYERCMGIPWTLLETKRCILRETTLEDVDAFYEIYSEPSMTLYMEGLFENPEDEKRYMRDYIKNVYAFMGFGIWSVVEKESGKVIGRAGYSVRNGFDCPELGFLIGVPWQGKGMATEVLTQVLSYGKNTLGFDTVHALVRQENEKSVHILEKLGFKITGSVMAEENIYGDIYPGENARSLNETVKPKYGAYVELVRHM